MADTLTQVLWKLQEDTSIGLIVDSVSEVMSIPEGEIVLPPKLDKASKYIKGIGKIGSDINLILDCNKLLNDEDIEVLNNL